MSSAGWSSHPEQNRSTDRQRRPMGESASVTLYCLCYTDTQWSHTCCMFSTCLCGFFSRDMQAVVSVWSVGCWTLSLYTCLSQSCPDRVSMVTLMFHVSAADSEEVPGVGTAFQAAHVSCRHRSAHITLPGCFATAWPAGAGAALQLSLHWPANHIVRCARQPVEVWCE